MSQLYEVLNIKNQQNVDFHNTNLNNDTQVFIDPIMILKLDNDLGREIIQVVQEYFGMIVDCVSRKDVTGCLRLLSSLQESGTASAYTHIGYSRTKKGKAIGVEKAKQLCESLFSNKAVQAGLLEGITDMTILIDGISKDNVSDLITNVAGHYLINYSLRSYIGLGFKDRKLIKVTIWDRSKKCWVKETREVPFVNGEPIILLPKKILRSNFICSVESFIRYGLLPFEQAKHLAEKSLLCTYDEKGKIHCPTKKVLQDKLKPNKTIAYQFIVDQPTVYANFKKFINTKKIK